MIDVACGFKYIHKEHNEHWCKDCANFYIPGLVECKDCYSTDKRQSCKFIKRTKATTSGSNP